MACANDRCQLTNLYSTGALFTRLAPTAVALAGYFCIADLVLISQVLYYNALNARRARRAENEDPSEESPLIGNQRRRRSSSFGLPGSQRRHATHTESSMEPLRKIVTGEDETPDSSPWVHNALSLLAVYAIGFAGWFVSYKVGAWGGAEPGTPDSPDHAKTGIEIAGLTLGYFSAALYLWYAYLAMRSGTFANKLAVLEFPRLSRIIGKSHAKVRFSHSKA